MYSIILFRRLTRYWLFCWTYSLLATVELIILVLNIALHFRQAEICDNVRISIAFSRTALLFSLVILSLMSNTRLPPADLESLDPAIENISRSCTYGTFEAPNCPPSLSSTRGCGDAESLSFSQYIKVHSWTSKPTQVFGKHICPTTNRYLQSLIAFCFGCQIVQLSLMIVLMICERIVNVWVPHQEGALLKALIGNNEKPGITWRNFWPQPKCHPLNLSYMRPSKFYRAMSVFSQ